MKYETKSFQYKTSEKTIIDLKKIALDKGVNARDIIDLSLILFKKIDSCSLPKHITVETLKTVLDDMLESKKNNK